MVTALNFTGAIGCARAVGGRMGAAPVTRLVHRLLPAALLAAAAAGQAIVWQHVGIQDLTRVAEKLAVIGDVDGDGYHDLVVEFEVVGPPLTKYQLWTLSGKDGSVLRVRDNPVDYMNWCLASAGDFDGDGIGDYVVMLHDRPGRYPLRVEVRSGRDERLLWYTTNTWTSGMGTSLLGDLDLDGDGKPDLVMTAPGEHPDRGHLRLLQPWRAALPPAGEPAAALRES